MPAFVIAILNIFGLIAADLPIIEEFLSGFGKFIADELVKVFGQQGAAVKVTAIVKQAVDLVNQADTAVVDTAGWLKGEFPTIEALLGAFPGLEHSLYARYTVMADNPGVTHGVAAKVVESAHANVRTA